MPAKLSQLVTDYNLNKLQFMSFVTECSQQFVQSFDCAERILVISPILLTTAATDPHRFHSIMTDIQRYKPHGIVLINWPEPHWSTDHTQIIESIIKPLGIPYWLMGYYKNVTSTFFDFWAMCFDHYAPAYTNAELLPQAPSKLFLNHNRSNRPHRKELYNTLLTADLVKHGHISLHDLVEPRLINEVLPDRPELWPRKSANSDAPLFNVPNDPYTLGDLSVWRDHVLTVVSDGWWVENPGALGAVFLTEKVYKPIVGLRPFLYNGTYDNLVELKVQGFDIFEDVFEFDLIEFNNKDRAHSIIVNNLKKLANLNVDQRMQWYNSLMPRLLANKNHYYKYVQNQRQLLKTYAGTVIRDISQSSSSI